ncbi:ABC transporter ATP-binding protein [Acuticoccus sp.]|uniref:ABC transporter ATP-binding protein n=1 Tax=Acuticoccus sp. TaxID=1904378 RepID=UPI003B51C4D0
MAELVVSDLVKRFGPVTAVDRVSFTVRDGEFMTLLGPSGCGKSTTLAAVAGLDHPDEGEIRAGDVVYFSSKSGRVLAPENRNVGLVFQSYALWPHMTVADNLAFPLKLRKVARRERDRRIDDILALVEMAEHRARYPHQLSGGQQQRVALARTLVYEPALLLLDEPLSNLDAKLRDRARTWLRQLQSRVGITTIYVTHDQVEALALSDRIAVMQSGQILQLAPPREVYEAPASPFVADFIGTSNFFEGEAMSLEDGVATVRLPDGQTLAARTGETPRAGQPVTVAVRPEKIDLLPAAELDRPAEPERSLLRATVRERSYLGARYEFLVEVEGLVLRVESATALDNGPVAVAIPVDGCVLFVRDPQASGRTDARPLEAAAE